jgi:hypothetical protein
VNYKKTVFLDLLLQYDKVLICEKYVSINLKKGFFMNNATKLFVVLTCGIVGQAFTQDKNHKTVPLAAIALIGAMKDAAEIKDLILTAYNSLPPAEQQQIVNTLVSLLLTNLQAPQTTTTTTQPASSTQTTAAPPYSAEATKGKQVATTQQ